MTFSKPFLTLCMITKNEEENLPRALDSVQGLVDEIILVDTGSEDKTLDIALQYGAKTYVIPWQNDFSLARNYALDQAQGEWILFLDADEELKNTNLDLKKFLQNSIEEGFFLKIINMSEDQNILNSFAFRLFRNNPLYRYEGKIHEQILATIERLKPNAVINWLDIEIYHYGYLETQVKTKNKVQRNLDILLNQTPEIKQTSFYCFNLGMEYLRLGELSEAEKWLQAGWEKVDTNLSFAHRLVLKLITCLFLQEKYEKAVLYCQKGEEYYCDYADLYYYHGASLIQMGKFGEARSVLKIGLEKGKSPRHYISEAGCGTYLNLEALGIVEEAHLNFNLATDYFWQALKLHPNDSYYLQLFLRNLVKSDSNISEYLKKLTFLSQDVIQIGAEFLFKLGKYTIAIELLELKKNNQSNFRTLLKAKSYLMLGTHDKALELLQTIPDDIDLRKKVVFYIWIIYWLQSDSQLAEELLPEMNALDAGVGKLLGELQEYLSSGVLENFQVELLNEEKNIDLVLSIIEAIAAVLGPSELLEKVISLIEQFADKKVLTSIAKLLYKQKLYPNSLKFFQEKNLKFLDIEAILAFIDLLGNKDPVLTNKIVKNLLEQNPKLARGYLMGMDLWLKNAGKANLQIQKKIDLLRKIPPIC